MFRNELNMIEVLLDHILYSLYIFFLRISSVHQNINLTLQILPLQ
jgi:hypothetical protein